MSPASIRDLPLWTRFTAAGPFRLKTKVRDELAASVTDEQIAELIEMSASDSALDAEAAIRVLILVHRRRMSAAQRDRWAAGLLDVVRKRYPRDALGIAALSALRDVSPTAADHFLVSELEYDGLSDSALSSVITDLQINPSAGALARLEQLAQHNAEAKQAWERLAGISRSELERLAREWRETRRSNALDALWWKHISRLREGASATALVQLLGEPTRREGAQYWYEPADSDVCLFLEADDRDGLVSWKLGG